MIITSTSTDPANTWNDVANSADPEQYPNYYGPIYGLVEVPEPISFGALSLAGLAFLRRRRPRASLGRFVQCPDPTAAPRDFAKTKLHT